MSMLATLPRFLRSVLKRAVHLALRLADPTPREMERLRHNIGERLDRVQELISMVHGPALNEQMKIYTATLHLLLAPGAKRGSRIKVLRFDIMHDLIDFEREMRDYVRAARMGSDPDHTYAMIRRLDDMTQMAESAAQQLCVPLQRAKNKDRPSGSDRIGMDDFAAPIAASVTVPVTARSVAQSPVQSAPAIR